MDVIFSACDVIERLTNNSLFVVTPLTPDFGLVSAAQVNESGQAFEVCREGFDVHLTENPSM